MGRDLVVKSRIDGKEQDKESFIKAFRSAEKTLPAYRHILLANDPATECAPADFHYTWSDILLKDQGNYAIEGYRESAKSQIVLRAFILHCLTYPTRKRDYIVIIKKNSRLATDKLREIIREYKSNPAVSINLVRIIQESAEVFELEVRNRQNHLINVRIEAYGKGSSIRGLANLDRRPKIVILDDPQDREDADSETVSASDWTWFTGDVLFLGQHCRIFLIGNNLGERCIVERVFANAEALKFKTMRVGVETNGVPTWPSRNTIEQIQDEREAYRQIGQLDVWLREKMCLAIAEETRVFKRADRKYYSPGVAGKIAAEGNVYITMDPATSVDKTSCYRALVVCAVDSANRWYILDVPYGRWTPDVLLDVLFDQVRKWGPVHVGIEKGIFAQTIEPFIYKKMSAENCFFDIVPVEHAKKGSKLERIKMLAPRFKASMIWFPEAASWLAEMEAELDGVTRDGFKSLYVDLIDALAMVEQIAVPPVNKTGANLPRYSEHDYNPLEEAYRESGPLSREAIMD